MKLRIEPSAIVLTPSIGQKYLLRAIESVKNQTYKNLKHLVIADGREYQQKILDLSIEEDHDLTVTSVPFNTGGNGANGQHIYAAYPHLVSAEYVLFLDEDNWWDENHVQSLIDLCEQKNLHWAHSLRKVYVEDEYLADDCCEAIGRWPIAWSEGTSHLVDTSSYCFKTPFLRQVSHIWNAGNTWGEDRRFFMAIKDKTNYATTGLHTLHYRLPDMQKAYGGQMDIFEKGNQLTKQTYGAYPWLK